MTATKFEIIDQVAKEVSSSSRAVHYNIAKATITDIKKQKEAILQYAAKLDSDRWLLRVPCISSLCKN